MKRVVALGLWLASGAVFAEGGYIGAGIGQSRAQDLTVASIPGVSANVDDTGTALRIFGGLKTSPNLALEFAYEDLGEVSVEYTDGTGDFINEKASVSALTFSALGLIPLQDGLSLFGRFGLAMADVDVDLTSNVGLSGSASGSSTNPVFGFGAMYEMPGKAFLRGEFSRYVDVGDNETGESDVDVIGVSVGVKL